MLATLLGRELFPTAQMPLLHGELDLETSDLTKMDAPHRACFLALFPDDGWSQGHISRPRLQMDLGR